MAIDWIHVCLRAWKSPKGVVGREPFDLLSFHEGDAVRVKEGVGAFETSLIFFVDERLETYNGADDPHESFGSAIESGLVCAAAWIESRDASAFDQCRAAGLNIDVLIDSWIDHNQFDLALPAA